MILFIILLIPSFYLTFFYFTHAEIHNRANLAAMVVMWLSLLLCAISVA